MIDIVDVDSALQEARTAIQQDGTLLKLITDKENTQSKIHRWWKHLTGKQK